MTTTSFLGIPIDGDIVRAERKVRQRPLEEFGPLVQAVLDDDTIVCFGWRQYTPYFNDGEPCVFSACGTWFRTDAEEASEDDDDRDNLTLYSHPTLSTRRWNERAGHYVDVVLSPAKTALAAKCMALDAAIEGGEFDDVLLEAFGDHAEITVKRDGITVDFYEHD